MISIYFKKITKASDEPDTSYEIINRLSKILELPSLPAEMKKQNPKN